MQIMRALDFLHSAKIVHRDLKPRNLLVNGDCRLKLADFGLARFYNSDNKHKCVSMTEYVTTRWYRAPEILIGWNQYGFSVDMWAVGCIMGELMSRRPLFPGHDGINQIELICSLLGKPCDEYINKSRKPVYKDHLKHLPYSERVNFLDVYPSSNKDSIDLMNSLLKFDPDHRISAGAALSHPYLRSLNAMAQPTNTPHFMAAGNVSEQFAFEDMKLTIDFLREEIKNECRIYHPDDWQHSSVTSTESTPKVALDLAEAVFVETEETKTNGAEPYMSPAHQSQPKEKLNDVEEASRAAGEVAAALGVISDTLAPGSGAWGSPRRSVQV